MVEPGVSADQTFSNQRSGPFGSVEMTGGNPVSHLAWSRSAYGGSAISHARWHVCPPSQSSFVLATLVVHSADTTFSAGWFQAKEYVALTVTRHAGVPANVAGTPDVDGSFLITCRVL